MKHEITAVNEYAQISTGVANYVNCLQLKMLIWLIKHFEKHKRTCNNDHDNKLLPV